MKINKDYSQLMRAGRSLPLAKIRAEQYRKEQEAGHVVSVCLMLGILFLIGGLLLCPA